jgi:hypothetical protein
MKFGSSFWVTSLGIQHMLTGRNYENKKWRNTFRWSYSGDLLLQAKNRGFPIIMKERVLWVSSVLHLAGLMSFWHKSYQNSSFKIWRFNTANAANNSNWILLYCSSIHLSSSRSVRIVQIKSICMFIQGAVVPAAGQRGLCEGDPLASGLVGCLPWHAQELF